MRFVSTWWWAFCIPTIYLLVIKEINMNEILVCNECGYVGSTKKGVKGSLGIELVLWLLMIFPGLIYSIWRLSTKHKVCAQCGSTSLIPVDSPRGKKLMSENLDKEEMSKIESQQKINIEKEQKKKKILLSIIGLSIIFIIVVFNLSS